MRTVGLNQGTSPGDLLNSLWTHRGLVWQMTRRDVAGRYRGSFIGLAWSFLSPLLMLAIYTFVFSAIFKMRWNVPGNATRMDFAIVLFVGMIVHSLFAECVNRAPGVVLAHPNYVKRVQFPLEVLPVIALGSAAFHAAVSTSVLLVAALVSQRTLSATTAFLPIVFVPLVLATLGVSWFLASLGVYLRDVAHATGILTSALLFLSPVFYPLSAVPERYRWLANLNPLTFVIEQARAVFVFGQAPDLAGLAVYTFASAGLAWAGFWWFQRTRKGFADVI